MIIEKIQHHLGFSFLVLLVITQSIFFLGARASVDALDDLQALFINPSINANIERGELVDLSAHLYVPEQDILSGAYFTVYNSELDINANYDAYKTEDGHWQSNLKWDTNAWPAGQYNISATAYVFNASGVVIDTYVSGAHTVNLIEPVEYEAAQEVQPPENTLLIDYTDLAHIITPNGAEPVSILEPLHVIVTTEGILNDPDVNRNVRLRITVPGSVEILVDGVIEDCTLEEASGICEWEGYIDISTNLEPGRDYQLLARVVSNTNIDSPVPEVIDSVIFQTVEEAQGLGFAVLNWIPEEGTTIWGENNINLEFEPALPEGDTVIAKVLHSNGSIDKVIGPVEISNDRQSISVAWDTAGTEGDFADPIYPDNDLFNGEDYYKVYFYRVVDGVEQDLEGLLALHTVDNYTNIEPTLVEPGPVSQMANLLFGFDDPLSKFESLSARVYDIFGNPYPHISVEEHNDNTLQVNWNTLALNDAGEAYFPNGLYDLQIIGTGRSYENSVIDTFSYQVQNGEESFAVEWDEPVGGPYQDNEIRLRAKTSQPASELSFEIKNATDTTIGSGILPATSFNASSTIWLYSYPIPSDWESGEYNIEMRAVSQEGEIAEASHGPLIVGDANQAIEEDSYVGPYIFGYDSSMSGIETLSLEIPNWSEATIRNSDFIFIVNKLDGSEVDRVDSENVTKDYSNKKVSGNINTSNISNGTYNICVKAFYDSEEKFSLCPTTAIEIFNEDTDGIPDSILGTLEGNFLELFRDVNQPKIYFRFETEEIVESARFMLLHLPSGELITDGVSAIKGGDNTFYESALHMPEDASWAGYRTYPPGEYAYFLKGIVDGQEKWSEQSTNTFRIPSADDFKTDQAAEDMLAEDQEIEIHMEDEVLETGDFIVVSTNFYLESIKPSVGIKFAGANGRSSYDFKTIDKRDCDYSVIPEIIRNSIAEIGHDYCWVLQVPRKQKFEVNDEQRVNDASSLLIDGMGRIMATYTYTDVDNYYARTSYDQVEFVFLDINVTDYNLLEDSEEDEKIDQGDNLSEKQIRNKTATSFYGEIDCLDYGIYDDDICLRFQALTGNQVGSQCLKAGIYSEDECENYLLQKRVKLECDKQEIVDPVACQDFLLEKYFSTVECKLDNIEQCTKVLREKYLNRLVVAKDQQERISSSTDSLIGQVLPLDELSMKLEENEIDSSALPLQSNNETKVRLAKSSGQTVLESEKQLTILHTAVMIIDTDADGLSDDMERYYGTDKNNPDSDGDSYLDGEEVSNGYNPMGEGKLEKERSTLEKIIEASKNIEQPKKLSEKIDKKIKIELNKDEENNIRFSGVADANTWITIFLYSDLPLVMTTKTDDSGNWTYDLQNSLVDGGHNVYVTVNDDTGNIVKQSGPLAFLVKSAQAVTADQYFDAGNTNIETVTDSMLWLYILGAVILIIFGIIFIFILHRNNNKPI